MERTCRSRTSDKSSQPNRNYSDVCPLQKGEGPIGHNHVPTGTAPGVGMATENPSIGGTPVFYLYTDSSLGEALLFLAQRQPFMVVHPTNGKAQVESSQTTQT